MAPSLWPAIITLLDVVLLTWTSALVGQARGRYGVVAPATTGNPDFERIFRVQMNTLESSVSFLPVLWVDALYGTRWLLAAAGLVWVAGRVLYALGYIKEARKRSAGYGIAALGFIVLLADAAIGVGRAALG